MAEHPALKVAAQKWGSHPMGWPVPPRRRPSFLDRHLFGGLAVMAEDRLAEVFGPITEDMRKRFWAQPGQSPYEDAGGAMLRCYKAMLGLPVERLPTYAEVIASLRPSPEGEANG